MQAVRERRGLFSTLKSILHLPGAPGTVEDRVRQIAIHSVERPTPECCPHCHGPLMILVKPTATRLPRGVTATHTFCDACGIEEEWFERSTARSA